VFVIYITIVLLHELHDLMINIAITEWNGIIKKISNVIHGARKLCK